MRPSSRISIYSVRHSHSIVFSNHNPLIQQSKCFPRTLKNRLRDPSEIHAFDFKGKFQQSAIWSVSATIGIDRLIFHIRRNKPLFAWRRKNTVSANGTIHVRRDSAS